MQKLGLPDFVGPKFCIWGSGISITKLSAKYYTDFVEDYSMIVTEAVRRSASGLGTSGVDANKGQNCQNSTPPN